MDTVDCQGLEEKQKLAGLEDWHSFAYVRDVDDAQSCRLGDSLIHGVNNSVSLVPDKFIATMR